MPISEATFERVVLEDDEVVRELLLRPIELGRSPSAKRWRLP